MKPSNKRKTIFNVHNYNMFHQPATITAPLHWCIKSPNTLWYPIQQLSISKHLKGRSKLGVRLLESNFRFLGPTFQLAALRTGFAQNTCLTLPFNNRPIDRQLHPNIQIIIITTNMNSRLCATWSGQNDPVPSTAIYANSSFSSLSSSLNPCQFFLFIVIT